MQPIFLLDLAQRKSAWLAARQAVVAGNVANANTPGYRPKDVTPFDEALAQTQLTLASTSPGHLEPAGAINRDYALTTDLLKSFHAMLMASLKP